MNKVILTGRITEPKTHTFDNGDVKTSFSLVTQDSYKKNDEWVEVSDWHNIVAYRETKLQKGDMIAVEGKIKTREYDDKEGNKKSITEVVAHKLEFLMRRRPGNTDGTTDAAPTPDNPPEDDLPF